ncbi:putative periplasmic/secreted protein [Methylophaga frappieri]|jgi:predicted secreted protein|uniref:Putative periplasmic/secreted protein n=1 Tax=Methylophaga frappieri (strain ATCC BAA-2434 / DSM 25690 / JAM7) TaxID=754477 RepID=I1YHN8_METFJ|nr:SIMPL domain-containing protein [Methylophaga frappieri]AFJ02431.1 putative periplasmic/secreted protein [Methylophaga frappieri]
MIRNLLFLITLSISLPAWSEPALNYNLISLSANAKTQVSNDEVTATVQIMRNGGDPTQLSKAVNSAAQEALRIAKGYASVSLQTEGYHSQPRYSDGKIKSWLVSQRLKLTASDFTEMSELLAAIQEHGNLVSMQFTISDEVLEETRQTLIQKAIAQFQAQASDIQQQFAASGYRLVNLSVNRGGYAPRYMETMAMRSDSMVKSEPVAIEAGSNEVSVDVHGQIQLIMDSTHISEN